MYKQKNALHVVQCCSAQQTYAYANTHRNQVKHMPNITVTLLDKINSIRAMCRPRKINTCIQWGRRDRECSHSIVWKRIHTLALCVRTAQTQIILD